MVLLKIFHLGNIAIYALHPGMILISAACTGNIMLHIAFIKVVASIANVCYHLVSILNTFRDL